MSNDPGENPNEVVLPAAQDEQGRHVFQHALTPTDDQRDKVVRVRQRAVIPVIFLPGAIGTNLRSKDSHKRAWRAPNPSYWWQPPFIDLGQMISALFMYIFRTAKGRQRIWNPLVVEPDPNGPIRKTERARISRKVARARNWGMVHSQSYHPFMAELQFRLNTMQLHRMPNEWWKEEWATATPADYGEGKGAPELTDAHWKQAERYRYDVWAGGYNWLQSCNDSAAELKNYIENTVLAFYAHPDNAEPAEKVILVTHSMGGLVSRALTELQGYEKVLGVVHGVMPDTGAPLVYHHCRRGYEKEGILWGFFDFLPTFLGKNTKHVTAVMGNSPGALELAPSPNYNQGKPWLYLRDSHNNNHRALPERGDVYGEIYTSTAWYGLVPEYNTKYLDLSKDSNKEDQVSIKDEREKFNDLIDGADKFHKSIATQYHPETYVYFGDDSKRKSFDIVEWKGDWQAMEKQDMADFKDNHNGQIHAGTGTVDFQKSSGPGDGTVPTASAEQPARGAVRAVFRQGMNGKGSKNTGKKGFDHQDSYNDERAQWAALYSIIMIAQQANWYGK